MCFNQPKHVLQVHLSSFLNNQGSPTYMAASKSLIQNLGAIGCACAYKYFNGRLECQLDHSVCGSTIHYS